MATGITAVISPQAHRRIDQLTFPGLLAAAAWMARWDRRAAAVTLLTAGVEGVNRTKPGQITAARTDRTSGRWRAISAQVSPSSTLAKTEPSRAPR